MRVQPVLRLVEHDRPRRVEHVGGHLFAAMGRQAVHEQRMGRGSGHQGGVDLVLGKNLFPPGRFLLAAHRRPDVRVDRIDAGDGLRWAGERADLRAVARPSHGVVDHAVGQLEAARRGDVERDATHHRGMCQRRGDVVPVADIGDAAATQRSPLLAQRQHVGQRLARMLLVAERVDDVQPRGRGGHHRNVLMRVRAHDEAMDPALEIAGDIVQRLARAVREFGRDVQGLGAQLLDGDLERRSRSQRRLLEQQRHVPAGQRRRCWCLAAQPPVGFQLLREIQQAREIRGRQVEDGKEVLREPRAHAARFGTRH